MKHCIYINKTEPEVTFLSEEHIFPAGIGGIQKLPMEYVSHESNNSFSKMELQFMRNSFIALPRQFFGPGKRGSLNLNKATQGNVSLIKTSHNEFSLGFLSLGNPYSIPQVRINIKGTCHFISDGSNIIDQVKETSQFINNLSKYNGKYILIKDKEIKNNEFILGIHDGRWYLALSNNDIESEVNKYVQELIKENQFKNVTPFFKKEQPKIKQTIIIDDNFYRVCAKILFNYLAFVKGQEFVLQKNFDPIRNWILNGGKNSFAELAKKDLQIPFPEQAHKLIITKRGKELIGYISFYGDGFETSVTLCKDLDGFFDVEGFICDWKNRQEFRFIDYINSLQEN